MIARRYGPHAVVLQADDGIEACLRTLAKCAGWEISRTTRREAEHVEEVTVTYERAITTDGREGVAA